MELSYYIGTPFAENYQIILILVIARGLEIFGVRDSGGSYFGIAPIYRRERKKRRCLYRQQIS